MIPAEQTPDERQGGGVMWLALPDEDCTEGRAEIQTEGGERIAYVIGRTTEEAMARARAIVRLVESVGWVVKDMSYTAPEQLPTKTIGWSSKLRSALAALKGGAP